MKVEHVELGKKGKRLHTVHYSLMEHLIRNMAQCHVLFDVEVAHKNDHL